MFTNIGGKIKGLAKFVCWIGIIGSVIGGIALISQGNALNRYSYNSGPAGASLVTGGIFLIIAGSIGSWLGSLVLYGFGELIERAVSIDDKLGKKASRSNKVGKTYTNESSPEETKEDRPGPVCELCGMECEKLTTIKIDTRKGPKIRKVCDECLHARNKSLNTSAGDTPNEDENDVPEETNTDQSIHREEIGLEGKCCICGIQIETGEMKEWSNKNVLIRSCEDCNRLLQTANDDWISGRKKDKAKQELKELLATGKVSQAAEPYINEIISSRQ